MSLQERYSRSQVGIYLDLDGSIHHGQRPRELGDNTWLWFTYQIGRRIHYLSEDEALAMVTLHQNTYHEFQNQVKNLHTPNGALTGDVGMHTGAQEDSEGPIATQIKRLLDQLESDLKLLWFRGRKISQSEVEELFEEESLATLTLREAAQAVCDSLNQLGTTALITGAFDLVAKVVATKLGIGHVWANSHIRFMDSQWDGFDHDPLIAPRKVIDTKRFVANCTLYGNQLKLLILIGDDSSDIDVFSSRPQDLGVERMIRIAIGPKIRMKYGITPEIEVTEDEFDSIPEKILQYCRENNIVLDQIALAT